jgi:hypothetical protein
VEKTCQYDESGEDLEKCNDTQLIPIYHKHTADDGTVTETLLGEMCPAHALTWAREHINPIPQENP